MAAAKVNIHAAIAIHISLPDSVLGLINCNTKTKPTNTTIILLTATSINPCHLEIILVWFLTALII